MMWKSGLTGIALVLALSGCGQSNDGAETDAAAEDAMPAAEQGMDSGDAGMADAADSSESPSAASGGTCYEGTGCTDGEQMMFGVSEDECAGGDGGSYMAEGGSCKAL